MSGKIGWKLAGGHIVKLFIPDDTETCYVPADDVFRARSVEVLAVESINGEQVSWSVRSDHKPSVVYRVGDTIVADGYDGDGEHINGGGIYYYQTRKDAVAYYSRLVWYMVCYGDRHFNCFGG